MSLKYETMDDYIKIIDEKENICLIDKDDLEKISGYNWRHSRGYWIAQNPLKTKPKLLCMHRIIMDAKQGEFVDHIQQVEYGYTDNRKANLRKCSFQQNCFNQKKRKNNTSGVIGVRVRKRSGVEYWRAQIKINGKMKTIGEFKDKERAIIARLKAEKEHFGEFAPQKDMFEKYGV